MEKPNYYSIIPAGIRYSKNLTGDEKLLYGELTCLANKNGYCYAGNNYFSKLYDVSVRTIQTRIANLRDNDFIDVKYKYYEGTRKVKERRIYIKPLNSNDFNMKESSAYGEECFTPNMKDTSPYHEECFTTKHEDIFTHNNIKSNNTRYNNTRRNTTETSRNFKGNDFLKIAMELDDI